MVSGDFEVVSGASRDGGLLCPLNACAPQPAAELEFKGREVKWKVTNGGDLPLTIERVMITWPEANGDLDELKRDGDTYHKGNFAPTSATIDSGWEGNESKRTIKAGDTDTLKFKFKKNASWSGEYTIVVEFTSGCSIEIVYTPTTSSGPVSTGPSSPDAKASQGPRAALGSATGPVSARQ